MKNNSQKSIIVMAKRWLRTVFMAAAVCLTIARATDVLAGEAEEVPAAEEWLQSEEIPAAEECLQGEELPAAEECLQSEELPAEEWLSDQDETLQESCVDDTLPSDDSWDALIEEEEAQESAEHLAEDDSLITDTHLTLQALSDTEVLLAPGETGLLEVVYAADAGTEVSLRWRRWDRGVHSEFIDIPNAESTSLQVSVVKRTDFLCVAEDQYGNMDMVLFTVSIENELEALAEEEELAEVTRRVTLGERERLAVTCSALDAKGISFQWYQGYRDIENAVQSFYEVSVTENATYRCAVTDSYGNEAEVIFHLIVDDGMSFRPSVADLPFSYDETAHIVHAMVPAGQDEITLRVDAFGEVLHGVSYSWIGEDGRQIGDDETNEITVPAGAREYTCSVDGGDGDEDAPFFQFFLTYQEQLEEPATMQTGSAVLTEISEKVTEQTYIFTPGADASYRFFSTGSYFTAVLFLDAKGNYLAYDDGDDDIEEDNFDCTLQLSADTVYYIKVFLWGHDDQAASFRVHVEEDTSNGHVWDKGTVTKPATCVDAGVMTYTCLADPSHAYTEVIPATGIHTPETIPAVPATRTREGMTEGSRCAVCGKIPTVQETTPKLPRKTQSMSVKAKKVMVSFKKLKQKRRVGVSRFKVLRIRKAKGNIVCKKVSGNRRIFVSPKGKITVLKGLKRGTYKVKIKVTAAGNASYLPKTKTVTVKVRVR